MKLLTGAAIKEVELDKAHYKTKDKTFNEVLEELDPTAEYKGTEHEGLDAFQRQLKRFDIVAKGPQSDVVEKFFQTTDSAVLFPEYVSRTVREGIVGTNILPEIIAATTQLDGDTYRALYMDAEEGETKLYRVGEGGKFPKTTIKTKEKTTNIYKFGRQLEATYESLRRKKLDVVAVFLRHIGFQIMRDQLHEAIDVIINGDGNDNAAQQFVVGTDPISGVFGEAWGYNQLLEFWAEFDPYEMNTILSEKAGTISILTMPEFKDPQAGFNFQATGKLVSPLGASLLRTNEVPKGSIIGMDKRFLLEQVVEQGVTTESDKLIDQQIERTVISQVGGFSKLYKEPAKVLRTK
jgi:hypothetical protein